MCIIAGKPTQGQLTITNNTKKHNIFAIINWGYDYDPTIKLDRFARNNNNSYKKEIIFNLKKPKLVAKGFTLSSNLVASTTNSPKEVNYHSATTQR